MNIWRLAGREEERQKKRGKVRALKRGELQTNSISGRQESGRGMERNIQSNTRKSVWESGRQSPAQEVKEIKENRQWVREKERNRRTERERQKQADREIHDLSLSNNGSSCGAQLSRQAAGIRNVECGISGLEVIATVWL